MSKKSNTTVSTQNVIEYETAPHTPIPVAYAVAAARSESGMTQKQLAAKTGIAQGDISRLENGLSNPSFSTLVRIAEAMGMEVHICFTKKSET